MVDIRQFDIELLQMDWGVRWVFDHSMLSCYRWTEVCGECLAARRWAVTDGLRCVVDIRWFNGELLQVDWGVW